MDEEIKINGEGRQLPIKFYQNHFAEGYGDREEMGETITSKGPSKMVKHSYVQKAETPKTVPPAPVVQDALPIPGFIKTMADSAKLNGTMGDDGKYHIKDAQH